MLSNSEIIASNLVIASCLRAVADPVRLRLLRLCADRPTNVTELAVATRDSEPNVSRHLKQLAQAGLLRRLRLGQRVEYVPVVTPGFATKLLVLLLEGLDPNEPGLRDARACLRSIHVDSRSLRLQRHKINTSPVASHLGRNVRSIIESDLLRDAAGRTVLVSTDYLEVLELLLRTAANVTVLITAPSERQVWQQWAIESEVSIGYLMYGETMPGVGFDVFFASPRNHESQNLVGLKGAITSARRYAKKTAGIVWILADYELLEGVIAPPTHLRHIFSEQGVECLSLIPIETHGTHLLAAYGRISEFQ